MRCAVVPGWGQCMARQILGAILGDTSRKTVDKELDLPIWLLAGLENCGLQNITLLMGVLVKQ